MCYIAKLHKDFINRVFMFVRHSVERVLDVPAFLSVPHLLAYKTTLYYKTTHVYKTSSFTGPRKQGLPGI
jgi:hypothetical protein